MAMSRLFAAESLLESLATILHALPPYPGSKRKLVALIFSLLAGAYAPSRWSDRVFADAFFGGGAVGLSAKTLGFGAVHANDIAERSAVVGRALLANSTTTLQPRLVLDILRTESPEPQDIPAVLRRLDGPVADFLARGWQFINGAGCDSVTRDLISIVLMKVLVRAFPLGLPTASDAPRVVSGDFDQVTPSRLAHYLGAQLKLVAPASLLRMVSAINAGVLPGEATISQIDVFQFLTAVEADVVYLDPPYPKTQSYESAFALLDDYLGAQPLTPSPFSSGSPPLDELIDGCRHIDTLLLSINNALLDEDAVRALVIRHRPVERLLSIPYRHYGSVATAAKNATNREFLVLATRRNGGSR
jgi:D12 class N6 adenine-specific DNA methyltransferase